MTAKPADTSRLGPGPLRQRWDKLPETARQLLAAFAIHPEPVRSSWLPHLAPSASDVDLLVAGNWIEEVTGRGWKLSQDEARTAIVKLPLWGMRQAQHQRLARLCCSQQVDALLAAHHFDAIGDSAGALDALIAAVSAPGSKKERPDLIKCLEAAQLRLQRQPADSRWEQFVRIVETCTGDVAIAGSLTDKLEQWLMEARRSRRTHFIGALAPVFASLLAAKGEHVAGAEWRVEAADALRRSGHGAAAARQLTAAALTYAFALQYSAARQTALAAVELADASGDAALRVEAWGHAGLLLGMNGGTAKGRAYLERALDLALENRLTSAAAEAYRMLGTVAEYASCYGDQQTAFTKALAYCRRHGEKTTADLCLGCMSYSLFRSGNWMRSRTIAADVLKRKNVPPVSRLVASGVMGLLLAHRGELREAVPLLEAAVAGARQTGVYAVEFFGLWGLALVEEQNGQTAAAALFYRKLLAYWRNTEDRHDAIPGLTSGALFFAARGDLETAEEYRAALVQIARETANPEAVGAAAVVTGELQHRNGKSTQAAKTLERALAAFERRDLVIERVRTLARYAEIQSKLGHWPEAKRAGDEARHRARRLGARIFIAQLENTKALTPAADEAPADSPDSWGGLSPRQRDVARELKGGLTNKEIAGRLGVSVRTVDMHVAHVLKRLDCRTRAQAAGKIATLLD